MKSLHRDDLFGWSAFDAERDVDFNGTVWVREAGNVVIDPMPLSDHDTMHLKALGDIAWVDSHLQTSRRPRWVSLLVDGRPKQQRDALKWARKLRRECPNLQIVTGHEPRWAKAQ